jgi:hypothetical protein
MSQRTILGIIGAGFLEKMRSLLRPKTAVLFWALVALVTFTLLTHSGARSPYTWGWPIFGGLADYIDGYGVNPDASPLYEFTRNFYQPQAPNYQRTPNINLPLCAFAVSIILPFSRSYILSNYAINLIYAIALVALFLRYARQQCLSERSLWISGLTLFSLPYFGHYLGQPLTYITGPAVNFAVALAACQLASKDDRNPWILGALLMILGMNYDPYVFIPALIVWVMLFFRFKRLHEYFIFFGIGLGPVLIWRKLASLVPLDPAVQAYNDKFFVAIFNGWREVWRHLTHNLVSPFIVGHVGINFAARQVLTYLFWPLLILLFAMLWRARKLIPDSRPVQFLFVLGTITLVEQLTAAAFEWENNPRRVLPLLFVFAFAYAFSVDLFCKSIRWRIALWAGAAMTFYLSFSDWLIRNPLVHALQFMQNMHTDPKEQYYMFRWIKLFHPSFKNMPADGPLQLFKYGRAVFHAEWALTFFAQQAFLFLNLYLLIRILSRGELLPRRAPLVFSMIFAISMVVRFF